MALNFWNTLVLPGSTASLCAELVGTGSKQAHAWLSANLNHRQPDHDPESVRMVQTMPRAGRLDRFPDGTPSGIRKPFLGY